MPGTLNDEVAERMREAALKGHNDEVMQYIAFLDYEKYSDWEQIDYIANTQIPYYRERKFVKTTAHLTFWLRRYRSKIGDRDGAIEAFKQVTEQFTPADV